MGTTYATGNVVQREVSWGREHRFTLLDPPETTPRPPRLVDINSLTGTRAWILRAQLLVLNIGGPDNFDIGIEITEGMGSDAFTWSLVLVPNDEPIMRTISAEKIFVDPTVDVTSIGGGPPRLATLRAWAAPISRAGIDIDYSLPIEADEED